MTKGKVITIILGLVIYALSASITYAAFSYFRPAVGSNQTTSPENPINNKTGKFTVPQNKYANLPRTEECPLNGAMYSKPERDLWEKRRPLGIMVENTTDARPQSGLSFADVVYEAVAEGGITRFLSVFYCQGVDVVGPVRSARTYYLDWLSEYGNFPLYAHVGGANTPGPADALGQIKQYDWYLNNDLEGLGSYDFPPLLFYRDYDRLGNVATEHTMYTSTNKIWNFAAAKRQLSNVSTNETTGKQIPWDDSFVKWTFKDDLAIGSRPAASSAEFNFSQIQAGYANDFLVRWQYDHDSNAYLRFAGGKEFKDMDTGQQILAKNIIIQFMTMSIANDGYSEEGHGSHTLYGDKGSGKAKFLIDGQVTDGTWVKKNRLDRTRFYDTAGTEIKLNRGLTWIETLPIGQPVNVQ